MDSFFLSSVTMYMYPRAKLSPTNVSRKICYCFTIRQGNAHVSTRRVPSPNDRQRALLLPHHLFLQKRKYATLQWYNIGVFEKPNCLRSVSVGRTCVAKVNNNSPKILQRVILCMSPMCNAMNPFALFIRKFQIATQSLFIVGSASCRS